MKIFFRTAVLLMSLFIAAGAASAQLVFSETFNYANNGGLVDCSAITSASPFFPVIYDSLGTPDWILGTAAADGPVLVDSGALAYAGYALSGKGKKVYLPLATSSRQVARRTFPAQTGKVYYSMMVTIKEQSQLGNLVVTDAGYDQNGTTIGCINTNTSSSGIRGLLVYNRADIVGGPNYGKVVAGVSYKRDDPATSFATAKMLDTLQTHLIVVCTDAATATSKLWINPTVSGTEPAADAVCTNSGGGEALSFIYYSIYQRSGYPSAYMGGLRVAASWNSLLGPEFSVNKTTIDFDSIVVLSQKKDSIIIKNSGSAPLNISSIISTNPAFAVSHTSGTVASGTQLTIVVTASLDAATDRSGKIIVSHNGASVSDTITVSVHPLVLPSTPVLTEIFNYAVGGLETGSTSSPRLNVSGGIWVCGTTSAFTDSLSVENTPLAYGGYSLSGIGKKLFLPNDLPLSSNDRAYRNFTPQTGRVYYSLMVNLKDVVNLSSNTSADGEYFVGLWPSSASTNALYRGLLIVRAGTTPGTYQLGVRATQPTANSSSVWAAKDLSPATTYLVVVSYERGPLPSASLWINPDISGREPAADAVSAVSVAITDNADIGRFGIYQRGSKPHVWLGGIRVGTAWSTFLYPTLSLQKNTVAFTSLRAGVEKSDSVIVSNTGNADLLFTSITSSTALFTIVPASATIAPGGTKTFVITAKLDSARERSAKIVFTHNGIKITDTLTVTGAPLATPAFTVTKKKVDFGTIAVGAVKTDSVFITNSGTANLVISAIASSNPVFSIAPSTATILPAQSQKFVITAKLDSAKHRQGVIVFTHNGSPSTDTVSVVMNSLTGVTGENSLPIVFKLHQNYPNPFNPSTTIAFSIADKGMVTVDIYDMLGRHIATLVNRDMSVGNYSVQWNASDLGSGLYFCRLHSGGNVQTTKLMLMK